MATEQEGHTPGTWVAEGADVFGDHNIILRDGEDRRAVAAVVSNMRDPSEVAANARLIAAAPDLLEAAKIALSLIDGGRIYEQQCCGGGAECGCRGSTYADEAVHFLRAAIARATGEA